MSKMHLIPKLLSAKTGISKNSMQRATVSEFDINKLNTAANEKINNNLEIIDNITDLDLLILSIKSRLKRYGTECIFIDNRTNIKNRIKGNSDEKNGLISYIFKDLAMELDIPIVMLVHKNKEMNTRTDKRPVTNDVKYGGDIAADVVIFAYRPLETDENKRSDDFKYAEWVVTKNRVGGDIGYVPLLYDESYDTFFDIGFDDLPIEGYDPYQKDESLAAFEKAMSEPLPQTIPKPNFTEMTESEAAEYF
jgi:replicative DNA helicase